MYLTLKPNWNNMYTDVRNYVVQCETCHLSKANRHPAKAKIQIRDVPPEIFQRVHIDHVKIAVKNANHRYTHALVLIDANSLCCELIPVKSTSAAETCRTILREWIAHYGVFSELVTDRHASFTGKLTKMLTEACGIRHVLISAYHSRSNGQVEKMNELVLQGIRVHCKIMTEWPKLLPAITASYKAAVIPSSGVSPFQLLYGINMCLPVETSLAKLLPAHTRPTQNAKILAKQLSLMRHDAQQIAQQTRQHTTDAINKTTITPEFEIRQKSTRSKMSLKTQKTTKPQKTQLQCHYLPAGRCYLPLQKPKERVATTHSCMKQH